MTYPTMTRAELEAKIASKEIRSISFVHTAKNGTQSFEGECRCSRCGGTGTYGSFGVCFRCGGSGYESCKGRVASEEQIEKNAVLAQKRAGKKEAKRNEAIATAIAEHPVENKIVAPWLSGAYSGCSVVAIKSQTEKAYEVVIAGSSEYYTAYIPKKALVEIEKPLVIGATGRFKGWYMKEFTGDVELVSYDIMKETEKALRCKLHVKVRGEEETWLRWIPKSCIDD